MVLDGVLKMKITKICKEIKSKIKAFDQDKTTDEIINLYKRVIKSKIIFFCLYKH